MTHFLREEPIAEIHRHTPRAHDRQEPAGDHVEDRSQREAVRHGPSDAGGQNGQDEGESGVRDMARGEQQDESRRQQHTAHARLGAHTQVCREQGRRHPAEEVEGHLGSSRDRD